MPEARRIERRTLWAQRRSALVTLLFVSVLAGLTPPTITPAERMPMQGVFFNAHPQVRAGGSATLTGFDRANLGRLDFTALPDDTRTLCGAGDLIGERGEQSLIATFTSDDTDPGCGFDHGGIFTITATVRADERRLWGDFSTRNAGSSAFIEGYGGFEVWAEGVVPLSERYVGTFTNTSVGRSGTADMDLLVGERTVSGVINLSNLPGEAALCGAGAFTGLIEPDGAVLLSFRSNDPDPGCRSVSNQFIVQAALTNAGANFAGTFTAAGQEGTLALTRIVELHVPLIAR
jgi:hypothetical protein